jgi:hexosaminidase
MKRKTVALKKRPSTRAKAIPFEDRVLPKPRSAMAAPGTFKITPKTVICADKRSAKIGELFAELLAPALGQTLAAVIGPAKKNCIGLSIGRLPGGLGDEGYRVVVSRDSVQLSAKTTRGLVWAIQTFRQLLPVEIYRSKRQAGISWQLPCGTIEDYPRFKWRGMMLDCSRHFMPLDFVRKWIDLLSIHKMNTFHWHLTDDQGWRLEIKKYPKLTEIGAWRKETLIGHALSKEKHRYDREPHGGFYTQHEVREVVQFAARRGITVVPEIELPGHSQAAIAAYPELGNITDPVEVWTSWGINANVLNVEESTIQFYQDILREVMELFPSPYIHIGGDEVLKDQWKASGRAQARITGLGLKDEHDLQSWFIRRMDQFLIAHGRKLVGWDEILEGGLADNAVVMSWRGEEGGIAAATAGHDVVMTPQKSVYFDHYQSEDTEDEPLAIGGFTPIEKVYAYEPVPAELDAKAAARVQGAQANLWTEYVPGPSHAEYMAYPRACALAEIVWSPKENRALSTFLRRLKHHLKRLKALRVNYRPLD